MWFRALLIEIILTALVLTGFWAFLGCIKSPKPKVLFCPPGTEHEGYEAFDPNDPNGTVFACRNCTYKVKV